MSDLLAMSQKELSRLEIIQRVRRKALKQREAAELLSLTVRQVKRLCRNYKLRGTSGLISKRRGRESNNRLASELVNQARELLRARYYDFGPTLAHEKLREGHGLELSVESVRQLMMAEGLWQAKRARRVVIHQLRERRARLGELVQIDGSPHDWFEGRAPRCTLLVMIDDASSRLMHLWFVPAETTFAYFTAVRAYVTKHGKPLAYYSDKFGVFRVNIPNAMSGTGLTQFGRALQELEIELICAHTPQAKGRVERANQTLQDRLVKEMRLRGISSAEEGNAYLPEFIEEYNRRFAVAPRSTEDAHRPVRASERLDRIFSLCESRRLTKTLSLSYEGVIYQIQTKRAAYTMRGARVEVRKTSTGEVSIEYKGKPLSFSPGRKQERKQGRIVAPKHIETELRESLPGTGGRHGPVPPTHPWKRFGVSNNSLQAKEQRGELCMLPQVKGTSLLGTSG